MNNNENIEEHFVLTSFSNVDEVIKQLESKGYSVEVSFGGVAFGVSDNIFGSSGNSGHYGATTYHTGSTVSILDSFGNRTFNYERSNGVNDIGWGNKELNFNEKKASEENFWHNTTTHIGTSYKTFSELIKPTGINSSERYLAIMTVKKNN